MKKLLVSTILIFVGLISVDIIVGRIFITLSNRVLENSPASLVADYAFKKLDSDIVIIGSSRGNHHYVSSLIEDSLNLSTYNVSRDGSFLFYQMCLIDKILDNYSPRKILWNLEPTCFSDLSKKTSDLERLLPLYGQSQLLDSLLHSESAMERVKLKSSMYRYNSLHFNYLYRSFIPISNKANNGYRPIPNEGYNFPSMLMSDRMEGSLNEEIIDLFNKVVDKCGRTGVDLFFCLSPHYSNYEYKDFESYKLLSHIAIEKDIKLIDFYHNISFMQDSTLFKDQDHMNDKGARIFTNEIIKYLQ
ncbi:MAG: hypothetical protein R3Y59_05590 [bacterium]